MSRVLITGCLGFYGYLLAKRLLEADHEVIGIDNLSRSSHTREELASSSSTHNAFRFHKADITNFEQTERIVAQSDPDAIVHLAALLSIDESMAKPFEYHETNDRGSLNVAKAALKAKNDCRIIYASSSEVYGNPVYAPMDENHPVSPRSFYAVTKLAGEKYFQVLNAWYGLSVLIIRNFNSYGPGQPQYSIKGENYSAAIPNFISRLLRGQQPVISGDGSQTRDFLYIDDAIEAYFTAIASWHKGINGETVNIGSGRDTSIREVAHLIAKILNVEFRPIYTTPRGGEVVRLVADITKAKRILNWEPKIGLEEGLERTIDGFRSKKT